MSTKKQDLRKQLLAQRLAMAKKDVAKKTKVIVDKLVESIQWENIHTMHAYTSLIPINEINTAILQDLVTDKWPHIKISTSPARKDAPMPTGKFDLIIVPILGFDKNNYRLGMGGGWYDRFLAKQPQAQTIGLAYRESLVDKLPSEPHDVALDQIITD